MTSRLLFHPILLNRQSRHLFIIFLLLSIFVGGLLWWQFNTAVLVAGIDLPSFAQSAPWYMGIIVSPYFRIGLIFMGSILAAGTVGKYVVGPVKRIEQWLEYWEAGTSLKPLKVREEDKFSTLVQRLNDMYNKTHRSPSPSSDNT